MKIIFRVCVIIFLFTSFLLNGCEKNDTLFYSGEIGKQLFLHLEKNNASNKTLIIDSFGGNVSFANKIALNIHKNQNNIIVKSRCYSACAEDLLPAAKTINFQNSPLIGFHWNSFMNRSQMLRYGGDVSLCSNDSIEKQRYIYNLRGLNEDFWRETEKRLVLVSYEVVDKPNACPWKKRKFENIMWFPTSNQLRSLWGLEFTGSVCADDLKKCKIKVDRLMRKDMNVVIGDVTYSVKG